MQKKSERGQDREECRKRCANMIKERREADGVGLGGKLLLLLSRVLQQAGQTVSGTKRSGGKRAAKNMQRLSDARLDGDIYTREQGTAEEKNEAPLEKVKWQRARKGCGSRKA